MGSKNQIPPWLLLKTLSATARALLQRLSEEMLLLSTKILHAQAAEPSLRAYGLSKSSMINKVQFKNSVKGGLLMWWRSSGRWPTLPLNCKISLNDNLNQIRGAERHKDCILLYMYECHVYVYISSVISLFSINYAVFSYRVSYLLYMYFISRYAAFNHLGDASLLWANHCRRCCALNPGATTAGPTKISLFWPGTGTLRGPSQPAPLRDIRPFKGKISLVEL